MESGKNGISEHFNSKNFALALAYFEISGIKRLLSLYVGRHLGDLNQTDRVFLAIVFSLLITIFDSASKVFSHLTPYRTYMDSSLIKYGVIYKLLLYI